jgi:4-hydroxyacetophenone monooxygenase
MPFSWQRGDGGVVSMGESRAELLEATDATIDDVVEHADPMVLRGLLYQLTKDEELPAIEIRTVVVSGYREVCLVARPDDVTLIRSKAASYLKAFRDSGGVAAPIHVAENLRESLSLTAGTEVEASELEMWLESLAVDPWARGFEWAEQTRPAAAAEFSVAVVGAGMGGLNAAVHLKRAGISFTVLEKNADVGGTWYENRYPGARVDSPSRTYGHVYGASFPKPYPYCPQAVNEKYFNWVADTFELRSDIVFNTDVKSVVWEDAEQLWEITAETVDGPRTWRVNAVISAVGFLSRPNIPKLDGVEDFRGECFHTARWPAGLDLTGKRVASVGTGCTGYQMVPELVKKAEHVFVFQRTPNWLYDAPGYLSPFPDQVTWLDRNFPYYTNFARFQSAFMTRPQVTLRGLQVDPGFHDEHAVSPHNKVLRGERLAFLEAKLGHRPDLLEKMTPIAPPMSARPVLVDRDYSILDVLLRDDVTLVTDGIRRVTEDGIELPDGTRLDVDVIVLATGFRANDFLWPMEVRGRDAVPVTDLWAKDGARAYVGSMLPGFPNFFMVYGPNTNMLAGLQIADMEEIAVRFALESIGGLIETGKRTVEVTEDAYWRYNGQVDQAESLMTYVDPRANSYFQNEFGRSAANGPLDTRLMWHWLRDPARRHAATVEPGLDDALMAIYEAIDPHFGADLVVE